MQNIIKSTVVFLFLSLLTSCSKDFLNENLTLVSMPVGLSNIYISPDWQSSGYLFQLPDVKEADYEIVSKPSWLTLGSLSGHLSDSIAIVQCSATKNSAFNPVGIYTDFMTVTAKGKNYKVPVAYITEGNPIAEVQSTLNLSYSTYGEPFCKLRITGLEFYFGISAVCLIGWFLIQPGLKAFIFHHMHGMTYPFFLNLAISLRRF